MSFWDIIGLVIHGVLQYILWLAPIVKPAQEPRYAPGWWYRHWGAWDWTGNLDSDNRPNQAWCEKYIRAAFGELKDWIVKEAAKYTDWLVQTVQRILGYLPTAYPSFSAWLYHNRGLIGLFLPSWANNLAHGLTKLWNWLPPEIRGHITSWGTLFQNTVNKAIDWARGRYENARNQAHNLWSWWTQLGHQLGEWWKQARNVLDEFRRDPGGFVRRQLGSVWNWLHDFRQDAAKWVKNWLGPAWPLLVSFADGPLRFYFDLWGRARTTLFDFLADPLEFLWDEAEEFLERKW